MLTRIDQFLSYHLSWWAAIKLGPIRNVENYKYSIPLDLFNTYLRSDQIDVYP